jgi:hypothetical protein
VRGFTPFSEAHNASAVRPRATPESATKRVLCFRTRGFSLYGDRGRFEDGRPSELFLNNHKNGNQVDTNARDSPIVLSFALQHGADIESIRKVLCRDSRSR